MKRTFLNHHVWLWLSGLVLLAWLGWAVGSGWLDTFILERTLVTETVDEAPRPSIEAEPIQPIQRDAPVVRLPPMPSIDASGFGTAFMLGLSVPVLVLLLLLWKLYHDPRYSALALLISSMVAEFVTKKYGASLQAAGMALVFTFAVTLVLNTHYPLLFGWRRVIPILRKSWRYREAVRRLHPGTSARWHRPFGRIVLWGLATIGLVWLVVAMDLVPPAATRIGIRTGMYAPVLLALPLSVIIWRVFVLRRTVLFLGVLTMSALFGLMAASLAAGVPAATLRYPFWGGLLVFVLGQVIVDVYHDVQTAMKARLRINSLHQTVLHRAADLKEMMVQAQAANLAKTQFVSSVSHELRTPLTAISGYAQILMEELPEENLMHAEFLGIIRQSCDRLKSLINDLLDMAKVESGRVELEISSIELEPVLKEIVAQLLPLAETKKLQMLRPRIDMEDPVIHADPLRLRQVLINLLSNAIKFTDQGCVGIYVTESMLPRYQGTHHSEPAVAIEVFDTGIGITPSFIDHLFEPFTQEESAYSNTQQGTGLGLSITKELVERMGGTIRVESVVGEGTKFTVLLAQGATELSAVTSPTPLRNEERLPEPSAERKADQEITSAVEAT